MCCGIQSILKTNPHRNVRKFSYEVLKSCQQSISEWLVVYGLLILMKF
jgi:hypothetical protein